MKTPILPLTVAVMIGIAASARAQTQASADHQPGQGPLIVERIPSGWVVSPDVTITEFNKEAATIIGAYGGWLSDRTWLVGAGGYWLANNTHDFGMAYGGLVTQYLIHSDRRIGFGVKGLVGGGDATVSASYRDVYGTPIDTRPDIVFGHGHRPGHGGPRPPTTPITPDTRLAFNEAFFIAEPQAQVMWNLTPSLRLTFGAGYRITAGADEVNDRIRGPIASVSVEFGGGH